MFNRTGYSVAARYLRDHDRMVPRFRAATLEPINSDAVLLTDLIATGHNPPEAVRLKLSHLAHHAAFFNHHMVEDGDAIVLAPGGG